MKKLLAAIDKSISNIKKEISKIQSIIDDKKCFRATLEISRLDPDSANYDKIRSLVDDIYLDDVDYVSKFKGWFDDYKEEEQIIEANKKYNTIIDALQDKYEKQIEEYIKVLEGLDSKLKQFELLKNKINQFELPNIQNPYITEEEFILIDCICSEFLEQKDTISIYIRIGKSNSNIELERKRKEELCEQLGVDIETLEKMSEDRTQIDNSYKAKLERLINDIDSHITNIGIIEDEEIRKYVISTFKRLDDIKNDIDEDSYELAVLFKVSLEELESYPEYTLSIILILIDLLNNKDYESIKKLKETHMNSEFYDYSKFRKQQDIVSSIQEIIDEYYVEEEYLNFKNSYCSVSTTDMDNCVSREFMQTMKIMGIIHDNISNLQNMNIVELSRLLDELLKEIDIFKAISTEVEEDKEEVLEGIDIQDVKNYVIIRDTDKLNANIEDIIANHPEVELSNFIRTFRKLFMIPSDELFASKTCKPITESRGDIARNRYNIREERSGAIRICFRSITTKNDHVVYEVVSFAYGSCGEKKKTDNLRQSFKEYGENKEEYEALEQIFLGSDLSLMGQEVMKGINFYNNLLIKNKNKKMVVI